MYSITTVKESRIIGSLTNCVLAHEFDPPVVDFWDFQSIGARLCRVHFQALMSAKVNEIKLSGATVPGDTKSASEFLQSGRKVLRKSYGDSWSQ